MNEAQPEGGGDAGLEKSVSEQLEEAEADVKSLQEELARAREEAAEIHRVGAAVLDAMEVAMGPLMARLAVARTNCSHLDVDSIQAAALDHRGIAEPGQKESPLEAEAEIQHLEQDIDHYQVQVERLQVEETQRAHELRRLKAEIVEAQENLSYEQQRMRHFELVKQTGSHGVAGWAGMSPAGVGRRTMHVRAEKKLRECAEQRGSRLVRNVSELAGDTAAQQSAIAMLTKKLEAVRSQAQNRGRELAKATLHSEELRMRLNGKGGDAATARSGAGGNKGGKVMRKAQQTKSTGKLPQLSF
eukprot:CAMPEP_0178385792 /NCGR_PEP_ID=MMETSP0689_2-20121128/8213_1 /TAXON_ID=160604 /ORGANISM="Amphidinium massartii, Strain CS-259" /LENGTH=300 /DNA_ID=CAMNT_0020006081 /DNA_START=39 /DNA_END=941 /DNA_ORIENTATION=+